MLPLLRHVMLFTRRLRSTLLPALLFSAFFRFCHASASLLLSHAALFADICCIVSRRAALPLIRHVCCAMLLYAATALRRCYTTEYAVFHTLHAVSALRYVMLLRRYAITLPLDDMLMRFAATPALLRYSAIQRVATMAIEDYCCHAIPFFFSCLLICFFAADFDSRSSFTMLTLCR